MSRTLVKIINGAFTLFTCQVSELVDMKRRLNYRRKSTLRLKTCLCYIQEGEATHGDFEDKLLSYDWNTMQVS